MVFNVIGAILKLIDMLKKIKTTVMALCLIIQKGFSLYLFFFTLERFYKHKAAFETYSWKLSFWRLLKINYWLCEIIDKAQNLNFNQSSLIGCLELNLDSLIAFFALTKHHTG